MKKKNSLFLLSFILLSMIFNIKTNDEQNVFNDAQNVAVKRFVLSRAGNIQKDQKKIEERKTFMQRIYDRWLDKFQLAQNNLTLHEIYENILKICAPSKISSILSHHAFTDLDFVREDGNDIISIFTNLIGIQTRSGEVATFLATLYPTTDTEILKTHQKFIQILESNPTLLQEIKKIINEIEKIENKFIDNFFGDLMNQAEVGMIKSMIPLCNKFSALWMVGTTGFFSFLGSFSLLGLAGQYIGYRGLVDPENLGNGNFADISLGNRLGFFSLSLAFTGVYGFLTTNIVMLTAIIIKHAQEKLICFATALLEAEKLHTLLKKSNLLTEEFKKAIPALTSLEQFIQDPELHHIKNLLRKNTFKGYVSALSNWGNTAVTIQALTETVRKKFVPLVSVFGSMDMHSSVAKLMSTQKNEKKNQFCYAQYIENSNQPVLELKGVWNPLVLTHKSINDIITNNVNFDQDMHLMMVTGPNTCGKTIITTSYLVAALFAQTLGIVPASSCTLTPFDSLYVLLTIRSDGSVGDSRFNAELREMKMLIDLVEKLQKEGKFALILVDEPFTGTNPKDGKKAALRFIEKMIANKSLENAIMMIATHYRTLTALAEKNNMVVNYQVQAKRNEDGTLTRFFKLVPGISNVSVVEDLLEKAGF